MTNEIRNSIDAKDNLCILPPIKWETKGDECAATTAACFQCAPLLLLFSFSSAAAIKFIRSNLLTLTCAKRVLWPDCRRDADTKLTATERQTGHCITLCVVYLFGYTCLLSYASLFWFSILAVALYYFLLFLFECAGFLIVLDNSVSISSIDGKLGLNLLGIAVVSLNSEIPIGAFILRSDHSAITLLRVLHNIRPIEGLSVSAFTVSSSAVK